MLHFTNQVLSTYKSTLFLVVALGCLALAIPVLCLVLLFENWIVIHQRYDYLQPSHTFAIIFIAIQLIATGVTIAGITSLFFSLHLVIGSLFFFSAVLAIGIYGKWKERERSSRVTPWQKRNKR